MNRAGSKWRKSGLRTACKVSQRERRGGEEKKERKAVNSNKVARERMGRVVEQRGVRGMKRG